jgi:hypothetical protein
MGQHGRNPSDVCRRRFVTGRPDIQARSDCLIGRQPFAAATKEREKLSIARRSKYWRRRTSANRKTNCRREAQNLVQDFPVDRSVPNDSTFSDARSSGLKLWLDQRNNPPVWVEQSRDGGQHER